ncbi:class I SAM-dependent methyltransferase [Streptomyces sp. NPDC086787]|uniref:class I SAM-dependent methyltransferase n=1 Tax=Streptomyces sp. NPDC086787 TaxID=3365759 RepID=UPI0037F733AE
MAAPFLLLREFIRSPLVTGAVLPSSLGLARQVTVSVPERGDPVVVELGPGTGAITSAIQRRLAGRGKHLAIERNPRFAETVAGRFPEVDVILGDATSLPHQLAARNLTADVIVSSLPWTAYEGPLLSAVGQSLKCTGVFTQIAYAWTHWTPPSKRRLSDLRDTFEEVVISRTVWMNSPPALIYFARRQRTCSDD